MHALLLTLLAVDPLPLDKAQQRFSIGAIEWAPDGNRLVFTVTEPAKGATRSTHIWTYLPAPRDLRQLTFSGKSESSPRFSPDGGTLAFTSNREEGNQIYTMPANGPGEASALTRGKASVLSFAWSADGKRIAYLASQPASPEREAREKDKDDARVVDHGDLPPQLWIASLDGSAKPALVPTGGWTVRSFAWNGGGEIYAIATTTPYSDRWEDSLVAFPVRAGEPRVLAKLKGPVTSLELSPDGKQLAFGCARVDGPVPHDLCLASTSGAEASLRHVSKAIDRALVSFQWTSASEIQLSIQDGFLTRTLLLNAVSGESREIAKSPVQAISMDRKSSKRAWLQASSAEAPELWFAEGPNATPVRVTNFHKDWKSLPIETFRYRSFDGKSIEGGLLRGASQTEGPAATVVLVHGGPASRWHDHFEAWGQLLASRGYHVFYPNPRGSTGYGADFVAANRADWGFGDFQDIMAGVEDLIARKIADPAKLAIGGWSYGGYMAMWAVTQTDRFRCAVAGAGMSDLASEFGTEESSAYDEWFFGTPYENLNPFIRSSPITYVKKAKTPTLILQGENDAVDPIGQSQQFHRALKLLGVPVEHVVYPREGHSIAEEKHVLDLYGRVVAWVQKHLPQKR